MTDNKPTSYDFEKAGKTMPFSVPDGFFCQLEEQIISNTCTLPKQTRAPHHRLWRLIAGTAVAAAATVALLFSVPGMTSETVIADSLTPEQAFNNLSSSDQEFLLDTYRAELLADY